MYIKIYYLLFAFLLKKTSIIFKLYWFFFGKTIFSRNISVEHLCKTRVLFKQLIQQLQLKTVKLKIFKSKSAAKKHMFLA